MQKLTRSDLFSLEEYAIQRDDFRAKVMAHKKNRQIMLGQHVSLHFEDRMTMQYQIQEMLRVEKIFEPDAIQEEIDSYNDLVPDGTNWKATMLIEYEDVEERREALVRLHGVEHKVWVSIDRESRTYAIANEDMERSDDTKTAAVHFLRFEFSAEQIQALQSGANVAIGIDNEELDYEFSLPLLTRDSLVADLT